MLSDITDMPFLCDLTAVDNKRNYQSMRYLQINNVSRFFGPWRVDTGVVHHINYLLVLLMFTTRKLAVTS